MSEHSNISEIVAAKWWIGDTERAIQVHGFNFNCDAFHYVNIADNFIVPDGFEMVIRKRNKNIEIISRRQTRLLGEIK